MKAHNVCTQIGIDATWNDRCIPIELCPDQLQNGLYMAGASGSGKTTAQEHNIIHKALTGEGFAVLDFHGDLIKRLLELMPRHRTPDVVFVNPADLQFAVSMNPFHDIKKEDRDTAASNLLSVFKSIWDPKEGTSSWGPQLEQILENSIRCCMDVPGASFLTILKMLTRTKHPSGISYRDYVLSHVTDPVLPTFWSGEFQVWPEREQAQAIRSVTNKLRRFVSTDAARNILCQSTSRISLKQIVDGRKILLIDLSKGTLGEENSQLFASLITARIFHEVMSRVKTTSPEQRVPFHLFLDEFQNVRTDATAHILSEARKMKLSMYLSHQFTEQISKHITAAVHGNIQTTMVFPIGGRDVRELSEPLAKVLLDIKSKSTLQNPADVYDGPEDYATALAVAKHKLSTIPHRHALLWTKKNGKPVFHEVKANPPLDNCNAFQPERTIACSRRYFGRPTHKIRKEVRKSLADCSDDPNLAPPKQKERPPNVVIRDDGHQIYFTKAFCQKHAISNDTYVRVAISEQTQAVGFQLFNAKTDKGKRLTHTKNAGANLDTHKLSLRVRQFIKSRPGKYTPTPQAINGRDYLVINLKR